MKPLRTALAGAAALLFAGAALSAAAASKQGRADILRASAGAAAYSVEVPLVARVILPSAAPEDTLVLNSSHSFNVTLFARDPRTGATGPGKAIPQNDLFGYFSIPAITANPSNPEVFVKVLDGTSVNGHYWVFYGGLTDLGYTLTVRENATGRVRQYVKPEGGKCGDFDTAAFPAAGATADPAQAVPADAGTVPANTSARTSVDIANNSNRSGVIAEIQYAYTCISSACLPRGAFYRTPVLRLTLDALDNFHQDDIVGYISTLPPINNVPVLQPGAAQGSVGTLLITFQNLDGTRNAEATVQARTYSPLVEADPTRGTVGFATPVSFFFEAASSTLVATIRDTRLSPTQAGALSASLGIRNSDINGTQSNVTVDVTFYDTATGARTGRTLTLTNVQPGELREVEDLRTAAAIPAAVSSLIVFADVRNPTTQTPTIEGHVILRDTASKDASFFEMRCADTDACGN